MTRPGLEPGAAPSPGRPATRALKIHLIGIGGTGMGALAGLLVAAGHQVRGSDGPLYPPMSSLLAALQIPLFSGYRPENLDWAPDRVVVGNICRRDHPEALAALERGLTLTSFPALLSELFLVERHPVVVAGTHGKTTTSSLMAHVLAAAGRDPGYLVGGIPLGTARSFALGAPPFFVIEGDEYDTAFFDKRPKFVHYRPRTVILTGVEFDHADIYPTLEHVKQAFAQLIERISPEGRLLVWAGSPLARELAQAAACPVETYGLEGDADWLGRVVSSSDSGAETALASASAVASPESLPVVSQRLEILHQGESLGRFTVPMSGRHNLANALAVVAAASGLGLTPAVIGAGLASFAGVKRRQELRGQARGVTVIDDFAHHPTAIAETLAGLKAAYAGRRLWAVFEPRSASSRRRVFQQDFPRALAVADQVVIGPLHQPEGIPEDERLDPRQLVDELAAGGTPAVHLTELQPILDHLLAELAPGDVVAVMSSGSFGGLIERLLAALEEGQ